MKVLWMNWLIAAGKDPLEFRRNHFGSKERQVSDLLATNWKK